MEEHEVVHTELQQTSRIIEESFATFQTRTETASNTDNFSLKEKRRLIEQTIELSTNYVAQMKTRLNNLVTINKLPLEVFSHIIYLTKPSMEELFPHLPYTYTWVCRHWRLAIIQNPKLWTSIRVTISDQFLHEVLRRSKSTQLDVMIMEDFSDSASYALQNLFAKESNRIRSLQLRWNPKFYDNLVQMVLSSKYFPSLQSLVLGDGLHRKVLLPMLPALAFSGHLETLQCTVEDKSSLNRLAPVFCRLKNLSVKVVSSPGIRTVPVLESLLFLLTGSSKLQDLRLRAWHVPPGSTTGQIVLPELQILSVCDSSLLKYFKTPKLSTLDTTWVEGMDVTMDYAILEDFDFTSIRYLYMGPHYNECSIVGSKHPLHRADPSFLTKMTETKDGIGDIYPIRYTDVFPLEELDILCDTFPRGCIRLQFMTQGIFDEELEPALSFMFARLTGLSELHLFPYTSSNSTTFDMQRIFTRLPSVEKLVVEDVDEFLDFIGLLGDGSLLPRLKHLSYSAFSNSAGEEAVGEALTKCLESRNKASVHKLKFIALRSYPHLPDCWLKALQELGTEVITGQRGMP